MKYIKLYENIDDQIIYNINDIVVCSTKKDKYYNYEGYIKNNEFKTYEKDQPIYGKKYKILSIYFYNQMFNSIKKLYYYLYKVNVKEIETGKILKDLPASLFLKETDWIKPDEPMIGDYVICEKQYPPNNEFEEFLKNNIGKTVGTILQTPPLFVILYLDIPEPIRYMFWNTTNPYIKDLGNINLVRDNIIHYSDNKEELRELLELKKSMKKFNL
jgi:hypothetical protein